MADPLSSTAALSPGHSILLEEVQKKRFPPTSLLAQLNSTVLSLIDRLGVHNVPRQMCYFNADIDQALDLILTGHIRSIRIGKLFPHYFGVLTTGVTIYILQL